jgi:RHS repeat-associated protein
LNVTLPNGTSETFTYRPNGPIASIALNGPLGPLAQIAYTYDDVLNVESMTDQYGVHQFGYDGLHRLTQATRPGAAGLPNESYAYDAVGNRKDPGNSAAYSYDANNRIVAGAGLTYSFDTDGNMTTRSDGGSFTYDARNRLVQFSGGAVNASYLHDANGRRIRKTVGGVTTWFLWDQIRVVAEFDATGNRVRRYGYLEEDYAPTQLQDANGTYYIHADQLQTPRYATDASGQIVWRSRHEAFGKAVVENDVDANGTPVELNVRFPGQYYDAETDLHYNYYRDYDPDLGRYASSDPIGLEGGINPFLYVDANPLGDIDALGLQICFKVKGIRICIPTPGKKPPPVKPPPKPPTPPKPPPSRKIDPPEKKKGYWNCRARADCNDAIPGNCPPEPEKQFAFGLGFAKNQGDARNAAKSVATHNLGCQPKHVSCKCTGPKGDQYSGGC